MRTGAFTLWLCFLMVAVARADSVLLFEQSDLRPGLCAALRIQLTAAAEVRCELDKQGGSAAERIARGAERVRGERARLGVLLERDPDPKRIRMYLVSARDDQAVLAIEDIEDRPEPDVDRSLALKIADAVEIVQVVQKEVPQIAKSPLVATLAAGSGRAGDDRQVPPAGSPDMWSGVVEAGAGVRVVRGLRPLSKLMLGAGRRRRTLLIEGAAGVALVGERSELRALGEVTLKERGPLASLRVLSRQPRFAWGGALEAGLFFVTAEGTANDGSRGKRTVSLPTVSLLFDARIRLVDYLWLRFAPALELLLIDRRFGVDGYSIVDDGVVRGGATLSLVVDFPLRRVESLQP